MNIAFFTEMSFEGNVDGDHNNMRTEFAWMVALDSIHHSISNLPNLQDKQYDLGIVIIPKKNIEQLIQFLMIENMKRVCKKIGFMQEGPYWYFQDYPMEQQIWFYNALMDMDVIFTHNQSDVKYFKGLTQKEHVYQNKSLMIADYIKGSDEKINGAIIGGNMVRWYGGFDSYIVAQEFNVPIYVPSMGRKIDREDELNIIHLPYMNWIDWMKSLSQFKYAIHLMPTHAAGTFAMNCAYWGIPCIGYKGLDTQEKCHPQLTVESGDMVLARKLAKRLKEDNDFYEQCSQESKVNYNTFFSEDIYVNNMKGIINEIITN